MNRRMATQQARAGGFTVSYLRHLINESRGRGGNSRVNPSLLLDDVLDVYERGLAGRDGAEVTVGMRVDPYSRTGRMVPTRDSLMVANILRDCCA